MTRNINPSRVSWASARPGRMAHALLPGRKALCGTHMGYGDLSSYDYPEHRRCRTCLRILRAAENRAPEPSYLAAALIDRAADRAVVGPPEYQAPCGEWFPTESDAEAHRVTCGSCAGVEESSQAEVTTFRRHCNCPGDAIEALGGLTQFDRCPVCGYQWAAEES